MSKSKSSRKKKVFTQGKDRTKKSKVASRKAKSVKDNTDIELLFGRKNYMWIFIGLALLALGFILMLGGEQTSSDVWEPDRIYSFRRITLAPVLILVGLGIQIYAIFKR
ncbi:MAG: DUF3098 domain-containing protein [Bacteroidetes bacterium]|jgi:hypothetical protein|nr:DUF3098 domain-containing protein [Bacteroidota bacterium]